MAHAEGESGADLKSYLERMQKEEVELKEALKGLEIDLAAKEKSDADAVTKHGEAEGKRKGLEQTLAETRKGYDPKQEEADVADLKEKEPRLKEHSEGLRKAMAERMKKAATKTAKDQAFNQAGKQVKSARFQRDNARREKNKEKIEKASVLHDKYQKAERAAKEEKDTAQDELDNAKQRVMELETKISSIKGLQMKVQLWMEQKARIEGAKKDFEQAEKAEAMAKGNMATANKKLNEVKAKVLKQRKDIESVKGTLVLLQRLVADSAVLDLRESWPKDFLELLRGDFAEEQDPEKKDALTKTIRELTAKNPRPAAPSPKPVANGGEQVQVLEAIVRLEDRLEDGLQVENVAAPSEGQAGSDNLLFYLSIVVVLLCTVFAMVLELNNRKSKTAYGLALDQAVGEKEEAQEQLAKALETVVATVLAWEEKTAGEGPKVVELDVQIRDRMDQQRDSNQELRDTFNRLSELVVGMQANARNSDHANRSDFGKLKESIALATTFAEGQKEEISSYKEGYHWASTGTFIKGVIRVVDLIDDMAACESGPVAGLDNTKQELLNLLGNNEVEVFAPAPGEPFTSHTKKGSPTESEAVDTRTVSDGEPAGIIEEVRRPGYRLELGVKGNEYRIIRPAKVVVSVAEKVDPEARQEAPGETLYEEPAEVEPGEHVEESEETTEETGEGSES